MDAHEPRRQPPEWLELRDLRYFLAVAEELSFTRAAERVHLAQQALGSSIRNLKEDLGVQLFSRSTRHVAPTAADAPRARHPVAMITGDARSVAMSVAKRIGIDIAAQVLPGQRRCVASSPEVPRWLWSETT